MDKMHKIDKRYLKTLEPISSEITATQLDVLPVYTATFAISI